MSHPSKTHAWAGDLPLLVSTPRTIIRARLDAFLPDAGDAQRRAWDEELDILQAEGAKVIALHPQTREHAAVLEYTLPREAGRRPDVVVLQNGRVVVVEFKQTGQLRRADLDQAAAYARDLAGYHTGCDGLEVVALLVLCGARALSRQVDGVFVVPAAELARKLVELAREGDGPPPDLSRFLEGEYAPLPTLVAAARMLFDNLPLPHIKRARSAGVHRAVDRILGESRQVWDQQTRRLVLVTGVPGAGKTLVGLQVAHSAALEHGFSFGTGRRRRGAPATFLSGNGPLVQVLQHALQSATFVQDMHRYIREYGLEHPDRVPTERLIVFDEAQRAWDQAKIADFYGKKLPNLDPAAFASEPELLTRIADRLPHGALVLALVGQGQEIHTGEEGGMVQWAEALARTRQPWSVLGPPQQAPLFASRGVAFEADPTLNLDTGIRYHAAEELHRWVELVLDAQDLPAANAVANRLRAAAFPIYVTRDLAAARGYLRDRFLGEPLRRYGLLASSKSERHLSDYGLDTGFQATKRIRIGEWFNADPSHPRSCCQLDSVVTEFQCQGLELDLAVVCWSDDLWWQADAWQSRQPYRRNPLIRDPHRLRTNAYRVLLTRGREGLVLYVPPAPAAQMDATHAALLSAGAEPARGYAERAAG